MNPGQLDEPAAGPGGPWLRRFTPILAFVAVCWLVFLVNNLLWNGHLNRYGIVPRHAAGLVGIFLAPFLHGSWHHLLANTFPLLVLGAVICGRSRSEFVLVSVLGTLAGGGLTWLLGRNAYHIGASGLIFCYFGYLASMAYFRRTFGTLLLSAVCILAYGGMLKGLLPGTPGVSWEGHVTGFLGGIALAWAASKFSASNKETMIPASPAPKIIDVIH